MADTAPSSQSTRRWLAKIARPQTPPPWSVTDVLFTFIALAVGLLLIGPTVASVLLGSFDPTGIMLLLSWLIGLVLALLFVIISRQRQTAALRLGASDSLWPLPYVLLIGVGAGLTINVVVGLIAGFYPMMPLSRVGQGGAGDWILAGLLVALVQPLVESLIFQGIALPRLRASLGPWPGVIATTFLYALYFFAVYTSIQSNTRVYLYGIAAPIIISLVLNSVRVYTESTRAVIVTQIGMGLTFLLAAITLVG
jgi:membrane protease YdiL (CAAX protease family)